MDEWLFDPPRLDRRRPRRCCWSCSGSRPSDSARPSTTSDARRRRAVGSAAGSPGTRSAFGADRRDLVHPPGPATELFLGPGDRVGTVVGGLLRLAGLGVALAVALRTATAGSASRTSASYPGALAQCDRDRVHRRGHVPWRALRAAAGDRPEPERSRTSSRRDLRPGDAPRGARPRSLHAGRWRSAIGLVGGWLTGVTGGIARGVPRPRRHAVRGLPDDRPRRPDLPRGTRGRGDRQAPPAARRLAGHRAAGVGAAGSVTPRIGRRPARRRSALYIHIPFCVSLCPYCDFVVVAGAAARGPRNRIAAVRRARSWRRSTSGPTPSTDAVRGPTSRAPPSTRVYLGGGTPTLLPGRRDRRPARLRRRAVRHRATTPRSRSRRTRGRTSAATPRALARAGVTRLSFGAQSLDAAELRRLGRRHRPADVADAVAGARAAGIGSINLDLLYDVPGGAVATWMTTLDAALALEPDHLSLYALTLDDPDAEGLTGPAATTCRRRAGARRWRERGPARARTRTGPRRSTTTRVDRARRRPASAATRSRTGRRPGHESRHNLGLLAAPAVRGGRARARTPSTARRAAGTPPGSTATWRRSPRRRRRLSSRRAEPSRSTPATAAAEAVDPRTAAGHGPAARGRDATAARRRVRLGARGRAGRGHRRRSGSS